MDSGAHATANPHWPARDDLLAHLHDWTNRHLRADVALYAELAQNLGGTALELACGSGRVLAGFGSRGIAACGVDTSPAMLRRARSHLLSCSSDIRLVRGDMRSVEVPGSFGLIVLARSALGYVFARKEAVPLLGRAGRQLTRRGVLVIDQVNLSRAVAEWGKRSVVESSDWDSSLPALVKTASLQEIGCRMEGSDPIQGTMWLANLYELQEARGTSLTITESSVMRVYGLRAMVSLLNDAELRVRAVYGDYDLGRFTRDSERMIVLAAPNA